MHPPAPAALLRIRDLRFGYPGDALLFDGWSADVGPGITLLQGDTGSGKSSLLKVIAGLLPASVELVLQGRVREDDLSAYANDLFFADASAPALDALTVSAATTALHGGDPRFDPALWQRVVEGFALAPHLGKNMFMLSTGSRRKVALAVALALNRPLTLLDEPTGGLDLASTRCLWTTLAQVAGHPARAVIVASGGTVDTDVVPLAGVISLDA